MRQKPLPKPRRPRKSKGKATPWPPPKLLLPDLETLRRLSVPTPIPNGEPIEVLLPVGGRLVPVPASAPPEQTLLFDEDPPPNMTTGPSGGPAPPIVSHRQVAQA